MTLDALTRHKITHALTVYDEKESRKKYHNINALSLYFASLQDTVEPALAKGATLRQALCRGFCGRLLDVVLKAVGEPKSTDAEQRM